MLNPILCVIRKADKVTIFEEAGVIGGDTPGPAGYEIKEYGPHKRKTSAVLFGQGKTERLSPLKRDDSTDFYETEKAKNALKAKSPSAAFMKTPKKSFAQATAERNKVPGAGAYKISDKAYKMLSPSPGGRRR